VKRLLEFTIIATLAIANLAILVPNISVAEVSMYKCVDDATGTLVFTDKACANDRPGENHRVTSTNSDSGYDPQATRKVMQRGLAAQAEFQSDWQGYNKTVGSKKQGEQARRDGHRNQVVSRNANDIYDARARDYDAGKVYQLK
jgi:hypothetical protein